MASDNDERSRERPVAARIVPGLFRSRNFIWDNDHRIVEAHGLTWSQFVTLISLQSAVPDFVLSPTRLYSAAQVSSGGMTKMLHALSVAGYVERIRNPDDQRSRLVRLLPSGDQVARAVSAELVATNQDLVGNILSAEECERLAELLQKLSVGLEQKKN